MRTRSLVVGLVVAAIVSMAVPARAQFGSPPVIATPTTGLTVNTTAGQITFGGGALVNIPATTVTLVDNQNICTSGYTACNIVYVNSGTLAVSVTSAVATAYAPGNYVIAFVMTGGGQVTNITTPSAQNVQPIPPGFSIPSAGLRLPLCNALLTQGCQPAAKTLSGY